MILSEIHGCRRHRVATRPSAWHVARRALWRLNLRGLIGPARLCSIVWTESHKTPSDGRVYAVFIIIIAFSKQLTPPSEITFFAD
ncbi:hypothetical protein J2R99_000867 [Rhodopseudomonas julia]|uniref:Uncharacterized protein n=1 Tax=Rhodopseudomonas julia TaxID=200617 RepID=A0ABU0C3C5_9BRAD|nr:hypothetical protein [Rhodopseudomonas julia]